MGKVRDGVYYRREDYAPFWLRLLVDVIDTSLLGATCLTLIAGSLTVFPQTETTLRMAFAVVALIVYLYLVVLKRSGIGTVGYRVGRLRIVGLDGNTATLGALTVRVLFAALGPLNWLIDLIWISNDAQRQSLRDKLAGTYVVRANAEPAGTGRITRRYYEIMGYNFVFQEVDAQAPGGESDTNCAEFNA